MVVKEAKGESGGRGHVLGSRLDLSAETSHDHDSMNAFNASHKDKYSDAVVRMCAPPLRRAIISSMT